MEGRRWRRRLCLGCAFVLIAPCVAVWLFIRPHLNHPRGYDRLIQAIERNDADAVTAVLNSGVDPNAYPDTDADQFFEDDSRPIDVAASDGSAGMVRLLLDHGADPNLGDGWNATPLSAAVEGESIETMQLLIQRGARVNDYPGGSSALWRAATDGKAKAVEFLLDHGASFDSGNKSLIDALRELGGSPRIIAILQKRALSRK